MNKYSLIIVDTILVIINRYVKVTLNDLYRKNIIIIKLTEL